MRNISTWRRMSIGILGGCCLLIVSSCVEKGAMQVNCAGTGGGTGDTPGCTGTTNFPVPNTFNCTHDSPTSNICNNENGQCGPMNRFKCKTQNAGGGLCNCSCM